jgi:hypothetical protein
MENPLRNPIAVKMVRVDEVTAVRRVRLLVVISDVP